MLTCEEGFELEQCPEHLGLAGYSGLGNTLLLTLDWDE